MHITNIDILPIEKYPISEYDLVKLKKQNNTSCQKIKQL